MIKVKMITECLTCLLDPGLISGIQCSERLFSNNGDEAKYSMLKCSLFGATSIVNLTFSLQIIQLSLDILIKRSFKLQREYILAKPARDAAAKAKMEEEASKLIEVPIHDDNEWNIR